MPRHEETGAKVAAIGSLAQVAGFGLAGAVVLPAEDGTEALAAWESLDDDYVVVILTATAASGIGAETTSQVTRFAVVMPT
jgi:vacuolar-type H+-ATPase subunit F/Vma7